MDAPPAPALERTGARRASTDIALQLATRTLNLVLGVGVTIVLVQGLGTRDFGRWSTLFAVVQIAGYFGDLRLDQVAVHRAAVDPAREANWLGTLLTLRVAIAFPVALATLLGTLLIADGASMRVAGALIAATILVGAGASAGAIFQLRVRNAVNAGIEFGNGLLWALAVAGIAVLGGGLVAYAAAFLGVLTLTSLAQLVLALRTVRFHLRGSRARWPMLLSAGFASGLSGLLIVAYGRIDQVLVFELQGQRQAGLYGAVYRILDRAQLIPGAVVLTLFPILAAAHGRDAERVRRVFQAALEYLLIAAAPLLAFSIVAAGPAVKLLFGSPFADAAPALPILMGAFGLICLGYLAGYMVIVLSLQRRLVIYTVCGLIVNVALNLVLLPRYGFLAAAWITAVTELVVLSLTMRDVLRVIELRPALRRIAQTLAASAAMACVVWWERSAGAPLALLAMTAVIVYGGLLVALGTLRPVHLRALRAGAP